MNNVMRCCQMRRLTMEFTRNLNSNTASICKIHRKKYTRMYPTVLVLPDGSSINIKYHEPRQIIKLPVDLSTLPEEQRLNRLERRKPIEKVKFVEDVEDDFDASKYLKLMKK